MKALALFLLVFVSVSTASAQPLVVIVRHAEKAANGGDDPDLSSAGRARAEALARILKDSGITAIFSTEFKRTQETAAPTATSAHVTPTVVAAKDTAALVEKLHQLNGNALIVGHGDTIPCRNGVASKHLTFFAKNPRNLNLLLRSGKIGRRGKESYP